MATEIKIKRSSVSGAVPTHGNNIATGEIALNMADRNMYYSDGTTVKQIKGHHIGPTAPTSPAPVEGDLWYDSNNDVFKTYNGTSWDSAGGITQEQMEDILGNSFLQAGNGVSLTYDDANNELLIESDTVEETVKNVSGGSLSAGTVVYQSGSTGTIAEIQAADADVSSKMPAIGILAETLANGAEGKMVLLGKISGIDTSSFTAGATVYVSTTAGALTATPPTGEASLIQNIGKVIKVHASNGVIVVTGAGRSNATPNLDSGKFFLGNGSNQAVTATFSTEVQTVGDARYLLDSELTSEASVKALNQGVATTDSPTFVDVTATDHVYLGQIGSSFGQMYMYGDGAGSNNGAEFYMYTAADYDTSIDYYRFRLFQEDFFIQDNSGNTLLRHDYSAGTWWMPTTRLQLGTNDTTFGDLNLYGDGTGSSQGGMIRLYNAADYDTTNDGYNIKAWNDSLTFELAAGTDIFTYTNSDGAFRFPEGKLYAGTNDSKRGALYLFGDGTGSTLGGEIFMYTGADHDTSPDPNYYHIRTISEDFYVTTSSNTLLQWDHSASQWLMPQSGGLDVTGPISLGSAVVETVYALSGTTPALDPANGTVQTWTLSGNSTPTDSLAAGEAITLMIDDGTNYTITWPTMTWVNNAGSAPTLATSGYTVIALWKVSTTLYGALVGDGS